MLSLQRFVISFVDRKRFVTDCAQQRGTQKVEKAKSQPGIFVVWLQWFTDSVAQWKRQDERRYLLDVNDESSPQNDIASSSPPSDPNAISTDTDPEGLVGDGDDDEMLEDLLDEMPHSMPDDGQDRARSRRSGNTASLRVNWVMELRQQAEANDQKEASSDNNAL